MREVWSSKEAVWLMDLTLKTIKVQWRRGEWKNEVGIEATERDMEGESIFMMEIRGYWRKVEAARYGFWGVGQVLVTPKDDPFTRLDFLGSEQSKFIMSMCVYGTFIKRRCEYLRNFCVMCHGCIARIHAWKSWNYTLVQLFKIPVIRKVSTYVHFTQWHNCRTKK